ncbi:MAG: divalent-cation tolerance protein CutA [Candidatus Marinimicrobia bacterium]|nr:divalent-cation tolerance protein CutA [Candidatus Neomarinimicrobiota bacterium]
MNKKTILILNTVATTNEGKRIASDLIEKKLAACVNILPKMTSVYRWENKVHNEDEFLLIIKTAKHLEQEVYNYIRDNHSYDVPEIITLDIKNIDKKYSEWLNSSIKPKK